MCMRGLVIAFFKVPLPIVIISCKVLHFYFYEEFLSNAMVFIDSPVEKKIAEKSGKTKKERNMAGRG